MFRIIFAILLLISSPAWAVTQWNKAIPAAGDSKSAWPGQTTAQWSILDTLLSNYKRNMIVSYTNATTLSVAAGECVVSNSGGSLRLFLQNAGNTAITSSNLDVGSSFSGGTTYYVYAGTSTSTAASATFYISLSSTAPTGVTYYLQLGNFTTDGSGNVTATITNVNLPSTGFGAWTSKSLGTAYQATTDGFVTFVCADVDNGDDFQILTDSNSPPTTMRQRIYTPSSTTAFAGSMTSPVRKNDYYKVSAVSGSCSSPTMYFLPSGS